MSRQANPTRQPRASAPALRRIKSPISISSSISDLAKGGVLLGLGLVVASGCTGAEIEIKDEIVGNYAVPSLAQEGVYECVGNPEFEECKNEFPPDDRIVVCSQNDMNYASACYACANGVESFTTGECENPNLYPFGIRTEEECEEQGGVWAFWGRRNLGKTCNLRNNDGGAKCYTSLDCESSYCLYFGEVDFSGRNVGQCPDFRSVGGCPLRYLNRGGEVREICVD